MAIREIRYVVSENNISPSTVQKGGLQGEHCATELYFELDESLKEALAAYSEKGGATTLYYRFEAHTSVGLKNSTVPQELYVQGYGNIITLSYPLENWLTRDGGNVSVYLIFSALSVDDNETTVDLFTYPARLRLENVPNADYTDGQNYDSVSLLSRSAVDSANKAEIAAEYAKNSADAADVAREQTENARFALENGAEVIFLGGGANAQAKVDVVIDKEMSEVSSNPVQNQAITQAIKQCMKTDDANAEFERLEAVFNQVISNAVDSAVASAKLASHPVGSYYFSSNSTSPAELFGGEWEAVKDRFILAAGDKYTAGDIGGEEEVVLTQGQLPKTYGLIADMVLQAATGIGAGGIVSRGYSVGTAAKVATDAGSTTHKHEESLEMYSDRAEINFGNNEPHNNMPPYIVAYCWQRTA